MRNILIPVIVVILGVAGYVGYQKINDRKVMVAWDFVPENAIAVYESLNIAKTLNQVDSALLFKNSVKLINSGRVNPIILEELDSLHSSCFISFHITSKNSLDLLVIIDVSDDSIRKGIDSYLKNLESAKDLKHHVRKYKESNIQEFSGDEFSLSYVLYGDYLISSTTPYLVEDAIRTVQEAEVYSFSEKFPELFNTAALKNDEGNIYLSGEKISELLKSVSIKPSGSPAFTSAIYDVKMQEEQILLNGFVYGSDMDKGNKEAKPINLFDYVPNGTSYLMHLNGDKPNHILTELSDSNAYERLNMWLGTEIALLKTGEMVANRPEQLIIVAAKDMNDALNHINILAEGAVSSDGLSDSLYVETYSDYEIKELKIENFPSKAFGDKFAGFEQVYYMVLDEYMIFANTVYALKNLVTAIEDENTWGKSLEYSKFLNTTSKEADISYYFNMPRLWPQFLKTINPDWRNIVEGLELHKALTSGALQYSKVDDKYYSTVSLELNNKKAAKSRLATDLQTVFESALVIKPFVVRNHMDNSFEILTQDSLSYLYLLDLNGELLWKDSIGETINSKIHQIDFYKNKKLQYLFTTKDKIHLIDRNGNYVEGFPRKLKSGIEQFSVVDYDNSKNYRFITEDGSGQVFLYDKMLNILKGWAPLKLNGSLSEPVKHLRVRGKDYMIAIQENGVVNVMNRRGQQLPGFPVDLNTEAKGEAFFAIGTNASTTLIQVLSNEGNLVSINLEGKQIERVELYKPSKETQFRIVKSNNEKSYRIYRFDGHRLGLLDNKGNLVFEKDYLGNTHVELQYYDLGTDNEIYVVNDKNQGYSYLYDHNGVLINSVPINSNFEIALLDFSLSKGKVMLYVNFNNHLTVYSY